MAGYEPTSGRIVSLSCIVCDTPFTYATKNKGRYRRFCSDDCRTRRHYREITSRECAKCGSA